MSKISNLRYPKVFVFDPSTELIAANTAVPTDLTTGQVGFFNAQTGVGCTTTPTPLTCPTMIIHQNVGDSRFGTVRTTKIQAQKIRGWHAIEAAPSVNQVSYIGYDESDVLKTLLAYKGQTIEIAITVFSNELTKWFGPRGYTHRIVVDLATACLPCQADCDAIDPEAIADWLVAHINGTDAPSGGFPTTIELKNWVVALKVESGTSFGVKLTGVAPVIELLSECTPQQFYKAQLTTFVIGIPGSCPNFPITYTTKAKTGNGYPLEVTDLEKESQGYDRVREAFEYSAFMRNSYYLRAVDGIKYDFYYLEYDVAHHDSGIPKEISDPYIVIFICPNDSGKALEDLMKSWIGPTVLGFPEVDITSNTLKGGTPETLDNA